MSVCLGSKEICTIFVLINALDALRFNVCFFVFFLFLSKCLDLQIIPFDLIQKSFGRSILYFRGRSLMGFFFFKLLQFLKTAFILTNSADWASKQNI